MTKINIAKDFTRYPSGRYKKNGNTSGQAFRERFLEEPIKKGEIVIVELDGTIGYGSSFLEEAFGGLVRALKISPQKILSQLSFSSTDSILINEIKDYINEAEIGTNS